MASVKRNSSLKRLLLSLFVTFLFASLSLSAKLPHHVSNGYSQGHGHSHHHKHTSKHKSDALNYSLQERATTTYAAAVQKGRGLICLMESTIAKAATLNLAGNIQSTWLASDWLVMQGWRPMNLGTFTYEDLTIELPAYGNKLDAFFSSMGIAFDGSSAQYLMNTVQGAYYDSDYNEFPCVVSQYYTLTDSALKKALLIEAINDDNDQASEGIFGNMIDINSGTIVADLNRSPLNMNYPAAVINTFCPIRQWSDAVYIQWLAADAVESTPLNRIEFRHTNDKVNITLYAGITNAATQQFVIQALQNKGTVTEIPTWDANNQLTLTRADDGDFFAAILGSPNGAGCAYLLAQHKGQFGIKQLTSVSIWVSGSTPFTLTSPIGTLGQNLNLVFTMETVVDTIDV
ncbi:uncharacterized protein N7458_002764 [Penicillium daleae]|uniref:Uncharacterized protein n=1 Tax=Penicillium daleae TaxID=63821 RepID=A0AAD6G7I3_9EURO|nr:uncharacterized protein N7458_002764 [Penicillium daleae]KAJ5461212.1 hypothetical protein N7458_002764 [Penicillium daleae]